MKCQGSNLCKKGKAIDANVMDINEEFEKKHITNFEEVYITYYCRLKNFAKEYVIYEEDAENIVQDIFFELWKQRPTFMSYTNLSGFLFFSVKNRCIDFIRRKKIEYNVIDTLQKEYLLTLQLNQESLEEFDNKIFVEADIDTLINNAIESLPARCREIFVLKMHGYKQKKIAEKLRISVNTVENQMATAYKKLKEYLKDYFLFFFFF